MSIQGAVNGAISSVTSSVLKVKAVKALQKENEAKESVKTNTTQKKKMSTAVKQKRQSYLDQPTSIGGTLKDLNLSPEQKKSVRAQLKGGK